MKQEIRKVLKTDVEALKSVLNSSELFPSEYLDDMINDYFTNPNSTDIWFTFTHNDLPISIGYCAPEHFTEGTYNLLAIAVDKGQQGNGIGKQMMEYIEQELASAGHRILIVETSGTAKYELTRQFYNKCDYVQEASIREFWGPGDDKVIFWKKLGNH